ncbi:repressor LexA [Constrictibacter sp. MBR-5]|jgi:repressor LexA|uniref:transcriptional repressor LexA n=1 Tax=Constrictibacter sp. MBR-5 TaxID=3156467 RepID=UPI003397A168
MLTRKQTELLLFINARLTRDGVSPSFEEMKEALSLKSKSGIHRLITGLEERGFIRRLPHRARALEVLRLPDSAARKGAGPTAVPAPADGGTLIQGPFRERRTPSKSIDEGEIPLYGRIAAGTPIEALRDPTSYVGVPHGMLGRGKHYALEVAGDSMIDAGIFDGDTVIVEECDTADPGTIIVALIDQEEVTLKRLRRHKGSIALEAANPRYETRIFPPDRVQVQGRLVALLRRY